ncbi:MAG: G5 domain-containing protein [Clostridia bacterium]|nr:G5 domain-containing protein [Clostridia bacterium]
MKKMTGAQNAMEELLSKSNETQIKDIGAGDRSAAIPQNPPKKAVKPTGERTPVPASKTAHSKQNKRTNESIGPVRRRKKKKMSLFAAIIAELKDLVKNVKIPRWALTAVLSVIGIAVALTVAIVLITKIDFDKEIIPDISCGNITAEVSADAAQIPVFTAPAENNRHTVTVDIFEGEQIVCSTLPTTVSDIVEKMNVEVSEEYVLRGTLEAPVSEDMSINYDKITYGTVTETASVPFETKTFDVQNVARGKSIVTKKGINGVSTATYKITYVNGVESERVLESQVITKQPVTQVIHKGVGGTITIGGKTYSYSHYIDCKTTVYTGGGTTASGLPATEKVIAVDPRVIPLGTQVYVEDPYCYVGIRTAADTGGAIKGNFIDIYFDESNPNLWGYGVRRARVYILD